jgi:hypothetical protein
MLLNALQYMFSDVSFGEPCGHGGWRQHSEPEFFVALCVLRKPEQGYTRISLLTGWAEPGRARRNILSFA